MRKRHIESPTASACTAVHQAMTGTVVPGDRHRISPSPRRSDRQSPQSRTSIITSLLSCISSLYTRTRHHPQRKTGGLNPRGRRRVETCAPHFNVRFFIVKFTLSIGSYIGKPHSGIAGQWSNSQLHPRVPHPAIISRNNPMCPNFGQSGERRLAYPRHTTSELILHHRRCQTSRHLPHRAHRLPFHYLGNALA